jgi:hypothetical protein
MTIKKCERCDVEESEDEVIAPLNDPRSYLNGTNLCSFCHQEHYEDMQHALDCEDTDRRHREAQIRESVGFKPGCDYKRL